MKYQCSFVIALLVSAIILSLQTDAHGESPRNMYLNRIKPLPGIMIPAQKSKLPADFLDLRKWPEISCTPEPGGEESHLVVSGIKAVPTPFNDWLPSAPLKLDGPNKKDNPDRMGPLDTTGLFDHFLKERRQQNQTCEDCNKK